MEPEYRNCEIRLSDDQDSPVGILEGTLMRYGTQARDRAEMFQADSLHWNSDGIVLNEMHTRRNPIVRFLPVASDGEVRVKIPLPNTQRGHDAAIGVRNGTYTGLSIEFLSEREDQSTEGVRRISRAHLVGAAIVDDASYQSSSVSVRNRVDLRPELETLWL